MKQKPKKTHLNSMNISDKRLSEFIKLFEKKTGRKLSEPEALARAGILLRTISLLYKPVDKLDYYSADMSYPLFDIPKNPQN